MDFFNAGIACTYMEFITTIVYAFSNKFSCVIIFLPNLTCGVLRERKRNQVWTMVVYCDLVLCGYFVLIVQLGIFFPIVQLHFHYWDLCIHDK